LFPSIAALKELKALATKQFLIPGDGAWPLGTLFPVPANKAESGTSSSRLMIIFTMAILSIRMLCYDFDRFVSRIF
jgi:hypothetical protein